MTHLLDETQVAFEIVESNEPEIDLENGWMTYFGEDGEQVIFTVDFDYYNGIAHEFEIKKVELVDGDTTLVLDNYADGKAMYDFRQSHQYQMTEQLYQSL